MLYWESEDTKFNRAEIQINCLTYQADCPAPTKNELGKLDGRERQLD